MKEHKDNEMIVLEICGVEISKAMLYKGFYELERQLNTRTVLIEKYILYNEHGENPLNTFLKSVQEIIYEQNQIRLKT